MKAQTRIVFLDDQGEKFFGEGPYRLLQAVDACGSLRAAAISMGMAYSKAFRLLKNAEQALGFALTMRETGGEGGGGSRLTDEGRRWLERYAAYRDACVQTGERLFRQYFPRIGCVIMASGVGRRFGSDKLMAHFHGRAMIEWTLDAAQGLFERILVVTRSEGVRKIAGERGFDVLFHELPHRSDALKLGLNEMLDMDGCLFCPADQPLLTRRSLQNMMSAFDGESILRMGFGEHVGAPMLFPAWTYPELMALEDGGGRSVAQRHRDCVRTVQAQREAELADIDTPQDLSKLETLDTQAPNVYNESIENDRRNML